MDSAQRTQPEADWGGSPYGRLRRPRGFQSIAGRVLDSGGVEVCWAKLDVASNRVIFASILAAESTPVGDEGWAALLLAAATEHLVDVDSQYRLF